MNPDSRIDVSVIIVNYNVKHFLEQCLRSVYAAGDGLKLEVFVVDNASSDGSIEYLQPKFPDVIYIVNKDNIGFGRANNMALERATGKYLFVLNPDTLLGEDSLQAMIKYMDEHPQVGAMGPKILSRTGAFDKTSKRGLPTPWVSFCRISGLSRIFPKSKTFGRYDLLYLDPDQPAEIDALAGSSMFVRYQAYIDTAGFDPDFFMYGEDIDWSYRIKLVGWEVHYAPVTKIVHFRGESTKRSTIDRDKAFYGAMHLFADKHFRGSHPTLGHSLINLGIVLAHAAARVRKVWGRIAAPLIDWLGIWLVFILARWVRTLPIWIDLGYSEWSSLGLSPLAYLAISIQSTVWVGAIAGFGVYGIRRGQKNMLMWGFVIGFLLNSSFTFFFQQFAYSRFATLFAMLVGGLYVIGWRAFYNHFTESKPYRSFLKRRALVVGAGEVALAVSAGIQKNSALPYNVLGFIDDDQSNAGVLINHLPIFGSEAEIERVVRQEDIEEIIFAYDNTDYSHVLDIVGRIGSFRRVNFKIITRELLEKSDEIPLLTVDYLAPRGWTSSLRRITSLAFKR